MPKGLVNQVIEILSEPVTRLTWLRIAFLIENKLDQFDLTAMESYFQDIYQEKVNSPSAVTVIASEISHETTPQQQHSVSNPQKPQTQNEELLSPTLVSATAAQSSIQTILNSKINTIQSKKSNIVNCLINFSKTKNKQRVNCFGAALVSYLVAVVNEIPCQFYSSETHCWIEIYSSRSCHSHSHSHQQDEQQQDNHHDHDQDDHLPEEDWMGSHENGNDHHIGQSSSHQPHSQPCHDSRAGLLVDVIDNLKARKKAKLPLSIYYHKQAIDSFGLCLMLICNENPLSDKDILTILHHFKDKLKYSWEISKYFSLAHDLSSSFSSSSTLSSSSSTRAKRKRGREEEEEESSTPQSQLILDLPSVAILDTISGSFEFLFQKVSFHLNHFDLEKMFDSLAHLTQQTAQLCQRYSVNTELWFDEDCSFLSLSGDICEKFQDRVACGSSSSSSSSSGGQGREGRGAGEEKEDDDLEIAKGRYEEWIDGIAELCEKYLSKANGERFRRQVPMISGKRRRIQKKA
jgi:uncharacterized protein YceK